MFLDVKVDKLVRNDAHSLQSKSLNSCTRETLHDPALAFLLEASYLILDEIDHNVVVDHLEVVEALSDASGVWATVLDVLTEELSDSNAFPFEVLADCLHIFLALASGGTKKEDSANLVHFDLLKEELKRIIRTGNDKLLKKVFEKFVDLIFLKVLLDRLHVVELLHFVHLNSCLIQIIIL